MLQHSSPAPKVCRHASDNPFVMPHPVAVLFLHGIGRTDPGYSQPMQHDLVRAFASHVRDIPSNPGSQIVFEEGNWSEALQGSEDKLWSRLVTTGPEDGEAELRYASLRHFMVDFAADAIAYQPTHSDRSAYDAVHLRVADSLARLAKKAGSHAPLCVIAHSLGTVIASNYFYDLAKPRGSFLDPSVRARIGSTPLERGKTLALIYTLGSPIALWSLRYPGFGVPLRFPSRALARSHPAIEASWVNIYDPDDVIGYPLRSLNAAYARSVTEDRPVEVGSWLTGWNPLSHTAYWSNRSLANKIGADLARMWRQGSALTVLPRARRKTDVLQEAIL